MKPEDLLKAHVQEKKMQNQLNEILDLTQQLADATDRGDEVTVHMLLSMRREPLNLLQEAEKTLQVFRESLSEADGQRLGDLLQGEEPASSEETPLASQIAANRRLLKRVVELDQRINQKVAGEESVYRRS